MAAVHDYYKMARFKTSTLLTGWSLKEKVIGDTRLPIQNSSTQSFRSCDLK